LVLLIPAFHSIRLVPLVQLVQPDLPILEDRMVRVDLIDQLVLVIPLCHLVQLDLYRPAVHAALLDQQDHLFRLDLLSPGLH